MAKGHYADWLSERFGYVAGYDSMYAEEHPLLTMPPITADQLRNL